MRRLWLCLVALLILPESARGQTARAVLDQVATVMGGAQKILAVKTLTLRGTGHNYNFGQNKTPDDDLPMYVVTKYVRVIDFSRSQWRQDQTREPRFPTSNPNPQRQRTGFDSVAYDITSDTSMRRLVDRTTVERRAELLYHPIGFLQAALAPGAKIVAEVPRGQFRNVHLDYGGERFTMSVDTRTMLPAEIDRTVANQMLGDVVLSNEFPKWYVTSGIRVPIEIVQRIDGDWKLSDLELDGVKVDGEVPDISAPESVKNTKLEFFPLVVSVDSAAPGVWFLAGGSHNSVAIEMKDHLLLVEAPQGDERTLAVIQKAQSLHPDKPLRAVINTHHHFDHAGGIRAAISQGLTIYTHAENKRFFEDLARRKFTLIPDQLSKSPRRATIEPVIAKRTLRDATRSVELYEVRGSQHSASMLMVYLPAEKLLIEADLYTPPAPNITPVPPMPFAKDLVREIDRQRLEVEKILPLHGRIVPISLLRADALK